MKEDNFDIICLNFQENIIKIFNEQKNIPFLLKYYLFKQIWKLVKKEKIKLDYNVKSFKLKEEKDLIAEVPIEDLEKIKNNSSEEQE